MALITGKIKAKYRGGITGSQPMDGPETGA